MIRNFKRQLRYRLLPLFIAYFGKIMIRLLLATCKIKVSGLEQFKNVASQKKCILMLWHNRLALVAEVLNKFVPNLIFAAFISNSRDGEPLAILANSYQRGKSIRVPHDARHEALRKMINHLKQRDDVIIVTPDGPKGPRYKVKGGIAVAAKEASALIVPFTWTANRFWQLNTWDKLLLPKPFATIQASLGDPIPFSVESTNETEADFQKQASELLQKTLITLDNQLCAKFSTNPADWPK